MTTREWTGAGDGYTFADGGNWDTGTPVSGDGILFTSSAFSLENDLAAGTRLVITLTDGVQCDISGNSIEVAGIFLATGDTFLYLSCPVTIVDAQVPITCDDSQVYLLGAISGVGGLSITAAAGTGQPTSYGVVIGSASNTFTGYVTLNGIMQFGDRSELAGSLTTPSYINFQSGSKLLMWNWAGTTHVFPELRGYIDIAEEDYFGLGAGVQFTAFSNVQSFSSVGNVDKTFSFTGSLTANTLTMDSETFYGPVTLRMTSGALTVPDCSGILAVVAVEDAELYCGSAFKAPTLVSVNILAARSTLRLNGDNGLYPIIDLNNTLLQIGTPGNDPTTVTLGTTDPKLGTIQFDLDASKTPKADSIDCDTSDITLSAMAVYTTLSVSSVLNSTLGESYSILRTSAPGAISGTFDGLAENDTFVVGGRTLRINYTSTEVTLTDVTAASGTKTWSGLGADNNWKTADNWVGGVAPVAGDTLLFVKDTPRNNPVNNFAEGTSFELQFGDTEGISALTLSGNSVTLLNSQLVLFSYSAPGNVIISLDLYLSQSCEFYLGEGASFGKVSGSPLAVYNIVLDGDLTITDDWTDIGSITELAYPNAYITLLNGSNIGTRPGESITVRYLDAVSDSLNSIISSDLSVAQSLLVGLGTLYVDSLTLVAPYPIIFVVVDSNNINRSSKISATGVVTLTGQFTLGVANSATDEVYTIIQATGSGSITGTFDGLADGATIIEGGRTFRINYTSTEVTLTDVTPEPVSTLSYLAFPFFESILGN